MILLDVMGALHDCLPPSPFLNGMTQNPPPLPPITAELCGVPHASVVVVGFLS